MVLLGLDTASAEARIAVRRGDELHVRAIDAGKNLPARLLPEILALLEEAGIGRGDIERLAACAGPGSFTGLRVGLAAMQGLARGLGRPLVALDGFRLRRRQYGNARDLRIVLDSRRAELFCARFPAGSAEPEAPQLLTAAQLAALAAEDPATLLAGDALPVLQAAWPAGQPLPWAPPPARAAIAALLDWAAALPPAEHSAFPPQPLYLREADALPAAALPWQSAEILTLGAEDAGTLAAAAAVHAAAFPAHPWSAASLAGLLAQPATRGWTVQAAGKVLAVLVVSAVLDEAEVLTLATAPSARRQGHARRLLEAAVDALAAGETRRLHLEVATGNAAARALYTEALGFAQVGQRRGYYLLADGRREDALLLARDIAPQRN